MSFYARSANKDGERETVAHHLNRVGTLCADFAGEFGCRDAGEILGKLHDLGKLSTGFQEVLNHTRIHVNHALPGAAVALNRFGDKSSGQLLAMVIAGHHSELDSGIFPALRRVISGEGEALDGAQNEIPIFGTEALLKSYQLLQEIAPLPPIRPKLPDWRASEDVNFSYMLTARMLFSALVDADYSASAEHFETDYLEKHTAPTLEAAAVLESLKSLRREKQKNAKGDRTLNKIRDELFENCLSAAEQPSGLFTLTAPTGTGKTLSLLAFAAAHAQKWNKRRIILLLPFLALAEQSVKEYRKVIPELLESHSSADLSEETRLLAERWSSPCIVTTTVGFFEPLFAARPTDCRRLHQIANSVIVLDEAQSLPMPILDATLRCVKELCDNYGCTVVFSTATQPSFQYREALAWQPREIVAKPQALFCATRRVEYDWKIDKSTPLEQIADELAAAPQGCAILNLRKHARQLFDLLQSRCNANEIFFISTDLCLAHRREVLAEVTARLAAGRPCRLVSTQCIEAGVDLDFPLLYRALAPLEAIIQAAGRCNRNGAPKPGRLVVFIPDVNGKLYPDDYYCNGANAVVTLHSRHPIDCSDLSQIDEYYALLYPYSSGDKETIKAAISAQNFQAVAEEYRIIEKGGVNVVVPYGSQQTIYETVRNSIATTGLTHALMKQARAITVSTYKMDAVRDLCVPIPYRIPGGGLSNQTGWYLLGDPKQYDLKTGLSLVANAFDGIY
ncbi:MAG: CRISPR-associated endonuclease Cas3'' [Oscillospiraceae bacterium]